MVEMLHVKHTLIDDKGAVVAEWEFYPVSVMATVQFVKAVIANRGKGVRYVIDIALPTSTEKQKGKRHGHK